MQHLMPAASVPVLLAASPRKPDHRHRPAPDSGGRRASGFPLRSAPIPWNWRGSRARSCRRPVRRELRRPPSRASWRRTALFVLPSRSPFQCLPVSSIVYVARSSLFQQSTRRLQRATSSLWPSRSHIGRRARAPPNWNSRAPPRSPCGPRRGIRSSGSTSRPSRRRASA